MRVHSIEKIRELKKLRKKGYSINELVEKLSIPKTTVWHHIHNISVPSKFASILRSKRGGSSKRKQRNWEEAQKFAQKLLNSPKRELAIIISMLYWGEGSKKVCDFVNSDGRMIQVYMAILKNVLNIPKESLRVTIRIFSGMDRRACLDFWSRVTKIPKEKFIVRLNDGTTKSRTRYGMCRITVKKGHNIFKLMHSLIGKISEEVLR